ncbi:hypothetical protein CP532_4476 [Ophiocordyceps camponoti-leonardi (nom. inval.)]|nr:hypothetical protein CP532_4476 [Ophiocordyceps camponoti-leonardi (nom. inval.)]
MYLIRLFSHLLIARLAAALVLDASEEELQTLESTRSRLTVTLRRTTNTVMQAAISNRGDSLLRVFKIGSILDTDNLVRRLWVYTHDGKQVPFTGINIPLDWFSLRDSAFQMIPPKQTVNVDIDLAETYDLSAGGYYDIIAEGTLLLAEQDSNFISNMISYRSNLYKGFINGTQASIARSINRAKRLMIADNCNPDQTHVIKKSLDNCVALARAGEWGASKDSYAGYMKYFFHSNTPQMRRYVADVFQRLRRECSVSEDGWTMLSCGGEIRNKVGNKRVYTYEKYFWAKPERTRTCEFNDQAIDTARMLIQHKKIGSTVHWQNGRDVFTGKLSPATLSSLETPLARINTDNYIFFAEVTRLGAVADPPFRVVSMATYVPRPGPANLSPNAGLDEWLEEAKQCHYLPERAMKELCEKVKEILMEESNIQPVCTPVTVCGDIHGQFYDLLELFRVSGGMPGESNVQPPKTATTVITSEDIEPPNEITDPKLRKKLRSPTVDGPGAASASAADGDDPNVSNNSASSFPSTQSAETRFIFLGDFVDRGYFSLETFTLLMCLKAKYPDRIVLVRGNHESRQITQVYGFYEECQTKYGNASVWKACCQVFDFLVLAAIVDGEVLCVHGGLSPEIRTIDQIRVVARAQEIPHEGAFCDLVWSDPEDVETWAVSPRGAGWLFGDKVATEFNHVNGLKLIARAHQLVNEGYKYHFDEHSVVTVWSAPNYCYRCGNVASIMSVDKDLNPKFSIFSAVPDEQRHIPANRRGPGDYFL